MTAYYNEIDPFAAQWLRELIKAGHIAPGVVDERSIEDVKPGELNGFTQCHFFAGIGVWSYALRQAGWPDDRPVWTGSCPCQPFSSAGKGGGFDDDRHLWPAFHWLIQQCRPSVVFGEQVASKNAEPWIDLVQSDLEAVDYAFGCVAFPSAGVGAPHIRDRAYWLAYTNAHKWLGHTDCAGLQEHGELRKLHIREQIGTHSERHNINAGISERVADLDSDGRNKGRECIPSSRANPTNGYWADVDWLRCRDGKWRPVRPGTSPVVNGASARVGRLRGYGNAINAQAAKIWIETAMSYQFN